MFGYVITESISCGTPVLAFNLMGPAEIITRTKMGVLANDEKELLRKKRASGHWYDLKYVRNELRC
jgi:glycosyltransferase involved in cell wall biosynthesis